MRTPSCPCRLVDHAHTTGWHGDNLVSYWINQLWERLARKEERHA